MGVVSKATANKWRCLEKKKWQWINFRWRRDVTLVQKLRNPSGATRAHQPWMLAMQQTGPAQWAGRGTNGELAHLPFVSSPTPSLTDQTPECSVQRDQWSSHPSQRQSSQFHHNLRALPAFPTSSFSSRHRHAQAIWSDRILTKRHAFHREQPNIPSHSIEFWNAMPMHAWSLWVECVGWRLACVVVSDRQEREAFPSTQIILLRSRSLLPLIVVIPNRSIRAVYS
jgi:hypothetical protein